MVNRAPADAAFPPVKRRNAELALMLVAIALFVGGFAWAGLALTGGVPTALGVYSATFGALALLLHVVLRFAAPWADPLVLPLALVLNGTGLVMVWALNADGPDAGTEVDRQLLWTAIGMTTCLVVLATVRRPRRLQRYPYLMAAASILLIAIPIAPFIGLEFYGARRWIGFGGLTVQPSEFAKITLVLFLASYLVMKRGALSFAVRRVMVGPVKVFSLPRIQDMGPMMAAWGLAILLLVGTRDLGTSLLLFGLFLAMLYVATQRKSWIAIGLALFLAGAYVAWLMFWHVQQRVTIWLDPFDPEVYREAGGSHQLVQSLFALADGGLLGTGFGAGRAQSIFAADSDLILVSVGEKLGLAGLMAVVVLLFLLVERCFRLALASPELFVKMTAAGLGFLFAFQVFVVLGGVTRLIPLTGMTTPFMSAGGSSLMSSWIIIGLLLRMSDTVRRPAPPPLQHDEHPTEAMRLGGRPEDAADHTTGRRR
ncbi:cell division protein FtsW (lipid II flippase) [Spinactinospora alkalitolerans]|uniref:peptidoglycan glycosyltransferase n=1 Tax=Spinactinospora alkalitolerans TaxID=687207 RepID=A0A852TRT3_9ACTN|nr:FtsW/RodA/SpoVE family cell cycle protein [Spinactinospora alkalitolerans]NYE45562.1 cell division protein FtsW (lipid II flippase) [Spinactinospora alkalitolerans]